MEYRVEIWSDASENAIEIAEHTIEAESLSDALQEGAKLRDSYALRYDFNLVRTSDGEFFSEAHE